MNKIPVTNNFVSDMDSLVGEIHFADTARASFVYEMMKMRPDSFRLEVGYTKNKKGDKVLTEISIVNKYPDYHPIIIKRLWADKIRVALRKLRNIK